MGRHKRYLLILVFALGIALTGFSQGNPNGPPTPGGGPPCDPGRPGKGGPGLPPPVGLCLPIDDYVYILMAAGVMYGCYKLRKVNLT